MARRIESSTGRKNFDIRKTSQEQKNGSSLRTMSSVAKKAAHICYEPHASSPQGEQRKHFGRRYRIGGTTLISLPQAINLKAAIDFAASIGTPLVTHCIIHWVGTDAGDDPTGELFAKVRELLSVWLRRRGVALAAVWVREKLSGGQAEVEHGHLLLHLPDAWLKGAKLLSVSGDVKGGVELLQLEAALSRIVRGCAGRLEHYAVKLKIPTDGGNPGPHNGRSYDGLYILKGRWQTGLETVPQHQAGMAQASRGHFRETLWVHPEPWSGSTALCWVRRRVQSPPTSTRPKADSEVTSQLANVPTT